MEGRLVEVVWCTRRKLLIRVVRLSEVMVSSHVVRMEAGWSRRCEVIAHRCHLRLVNNLRSCIVSRAATSSLITPSSILAAVPPVLNGIVASSF